MLDRPRRLRPDSARCSIDGARLCPWMHMSAVNALASDSLRRGQSASGSLAYWLSLLSPAAAAASATRGRHRVGKLAWAPLRARPAVRELALVARRAARRVEVVLGSRGRVARRGWEEQQEAVRAEPAGEWGGWDRPRRTARFAKSRVRSPEWVRPMPRSCRRVTRRDSRRSSTPGWPPPSLARR